MGDRSLSERRRWTTFRKPSRLRLLPRALEWHPSSGRRADSFLGAPAFAVGLAVDAHFQLQAIDTALGKLKALAQVRCPRLGRDSSGLLCFETGAGLIGLEPCRRASLRQHV